MSDPAAFLRAILSHPDEDAPRLVWADWLDERGDPRGEFIRVQCELAKFDAYCDVVERYPIPRSDRLDALREREWELLEQHKRQWLPLRSNLNVRQNRAGFIVGGNQGEFIFRRGFVESVACTMADFLTHAKPLFSTNPIETVKLTDKRPEEHIRPSTFSWFNYGLESDPATLDLKLFDCLAGERLYNRRRYPTADDAGADLSRACVLNGNATRAAESAARVREV